MVNASGGFAGGVLFSKAVENELKPCHNAFVK